VGYVDLHCHLLPGVDDGPATLDESADMAAAAVAAGTRVIAATSHINRGFGLLPEDLAPAREQVSRRLREDGIPLEVIQGGEVAISRVEGLDDADLRALTLGGGPWLLLEAPLRPGVGFAPVVHALIERGHRVLIAPPERSPLLQRDPEGLRELVRAGADARSVARALPSRCRSLMCASTSTAVRLPKSTLMA
jgi:protein-tyrosine phosphatase